MATIDTTKDSITIVKSFSYRGSPEEYGNTYFFNGATPASSSSWKALADAVILEEKVCLSSDVEIVRATGHVAGESVAVWSYDYEHGSGAITGTFTPTGGIRGGGDTAVWLRWPTAALTSKGKPIFLRNYYHPSWQTAAAPDTTLAALVTALEEYGEDWVSGFLDGDSVNHTRAGPHGVTGLTGCVASPYVTTRTLERRGKRP